MPRAAGLAGSPLTAIPRIRTWVAVTGGLLLGFVAARAGSWAWTAFGRSRVTAAASAEVASTVDLFRLPPGAHREMFLVPAGPDANGEPHLAAALYPGETPPRELASLMLANLSADEPWSVDLETRPLACRVGDDPSWKRLARSSGETSAALSPQDRLRLTSLGGGSGTVIVEPHSLRRVLVALPPNCRIADLSGVQWGETALVRDRLELERIRRFREDPNAVTMGR